MSPLSRRVEEAGMQAIRRLRWPGSFGPDDFFADANTARVRFARLIGANDPSRVAIVPAVSYGIALAARNVRISSAANVVLAGGQFPSNVHAWLALARRNGATVRFVERPHVAHGRAAEWSARLIEAIDTGTAVVALGTVDWTDGTPFALEAIGARAREVGAAYVLDGIHSLGALPFDVERVRPDLLVSAAYKWLGGPMGIGVAYVGERFSNGEPLEDTWAGRVDSEDFSRLTKYDAEYRSGAERFDQGGRAHFVLLPMLIAALDQLLAWNPVRIQAYCAKLVSAFVEAAPSLGFGVDDPADRCHHLFALYPPDSMRAPELQRLLASVHHVQVSARGRSLRVAPFVYNNAADLTALYEASRELCSSGAVAIH